MYSEPAVALYCCCLKKRSTKFVNQADSMLYQLSYEANTRFTSVGIEPTTPEVM
ncbi:hypothetical protein K239x_27470 [Planctomycetes bacterium K23_9]|uniref:Uncharacterized protein n=1 Tax=Stieleria marina TaxID=1930275 RepID=A0A517NUF4_9BACT|nr:hypothetical protein K239x_27470 [Planctomycetes bacterium K23_9]